MTALRHDTTTDVRHDATTDDTLLRQHTLASITLESGSSKRTVQRWLAKCGDIGVLKDGTRYFSDAEKAQILSHQSQPKQEETIEAELVEPGAIELHTSSPDTAKPLIQISISELHLNLRSSDTSALDAQSEKFGKVSEIAANAMLQHVTADLKAEFAHILSRGKNLAKGIEAQALAEVAREMNEGAQQ